jgi:hypothetical protein
MISVQGVNVIAGKGNTVMTTSLPVPGQLLVEGITWYVAVSIINPLLISVCDMAFPPPGPNPDMFPELPVALQVKIGRVTSDPSEMLVFPPEQKDCPFGVNKTSATG